MEILHILLSKFLGDDAFTQLKPFLELLLSGKLDLKGFLNTLTPQTVATFAGEFFKNKNRTNSVRSKPISHISNIADKDIVNSLNSYFASY